LLLPLLVLLAVAVAVACSFVCHPVGICFCFCCCVFSLSPQQNVISTEALDSLTVQRAVERSLYFAVVLALAFALPDPRQPRHGGKANRPQPALALIEQLTKLPN